MARRLEVNVRTLRRYITILQDLGIPISGERGRNGSYELVSGHKLPPMMFTSDEALVLAVGLLAARRLGLTETLEALESTQAKLERVMPLELKERMRALINTVTMDVASSSEDTPISSNVLVAMSSGVQFQQRVHIHYASRANAHTQRDVDPYGLAFRDGCWYAVGWCHLRHELRSFRLDRITNIELLEAPFVRPADFDALAHLAKSVALLPRQYPVEILLLTDLATAQKEVQAMMAFLEPTPEGILMRSSVDDLDWLARVVARFSFPFVIRRPDGLRQALRERAAMLMQLADADMHK